MLDCCPGPLESAQEAPFYLLKFTFSLFFRNFINIFQFPVVLSRHGHSQRFCFVILEDKATTAITTFESNFHVQNGSIVAQLMKILYKFQHIEYKV